MHSARNLAKHALDLIEHESLDTEIIRRVLYLLIRAVLAITMEPK